jgi:hypothetical protein
MARKKRSEADPFQAALDHLHQFIADDLRLPFLAENRLSGLAYLGPGMKQAATAMEYSWRLYLLERRS